MCAAMSRCWCAAHIGVARKVRHETLANLSKLPAKVIAAIEATLKGQSLSPTRSFSRSPGRCRMGMSRR